MSDTIPEQPLPRHVDPRKFAQQGVRLRGHLKVNDLLRLGELLADDAGLVTVDLHFFIDDQGFRCLQGQALAGLSLTCQRCLEASEHKVQASFHLAMLWSDEQASQLPRALDPWLVDEGQVDLYDVIEDELMLSLPIVVYHDHPCVASALFASSESSDPLATKPQLVKKANPFEVLEKLKGKLD